MKVVRSIISGVFSIIYFAILICFIVISFASSIYNEKFYSDILKSVDLDTVYLNDFGIEEEGTVEDFLVSTLNEAGIDENISLNIIRSDEIKELTGKFISEYVDYVSNNEKIPQITREDVDVILNNKDVKELIDKNIDLTDEKINKIIDMANEFIRENLGDEKNG